MALAKSVGCIKLCSDDDRAREGHCRRMTRPAPSYFSTHRPNSTVQQWEPGGRRSAATGSQPGVFSPWASGGLFAVFKGETEDSLIAGIGLFRSLVGRGFRELLLTYHVYCLPPFSKVREGGSLIFLATGSDKMNGKKSTARFFQASKIDIFG